MLDSLTQNLLFPPSSQPAAPLLVIQHLNYSFGKGVLKKQILSDINLTLYPGEIVILTGAPGSGKTTLLNLIGGLRSTQTGSLNLFGQELKNASAATRTRMRRKIGFMFQDHHLLPFMTTLQNVQTVRQLKAAPKRKTADRAEAALTRVGLAGHLNTYPTKLSGGQKQRVAIARALVNEPTLILADEPTVSLDSHIGREVMLMMQRLAKERRCAVLLVTQDTRILDIADRIIRLEEGHLIQDAVDQAPHTFAALARAVPDRSVLDWAISNGAVPLRTLVIKSPAETKSLPARPTPAEPEVAPFDQQAAENPLLHPLVSDTTPLFFSKLSQNGTPPDRQAQPPSSAQAPSAVPIAQPPANQPPVNQPLVNSLIEITNPSLVPTPPQSEAIAPVLNSSSNFSAPPALSNLTQQTDSKAYTIACIDNNPAILYTMQSFLEDDLFSVLLIQDPEQALAEVIEHRPDVIVLNIRMPKLDGYEICTLIRQNEQFSDTPIIFITDDAKAFNSKRAKALGVTAYLKKPFNQADLIGNIFPHLT